MNNTFDCSWELLTSKCIDNDLIKEGNETIINRSLSNQCPRYNVSTKEIFIADGSLFVLGEKDRVIIQTMGIKFHIQKYFRCVLMLINGSVITTVGKIKNNLFICEPFQVGIWNKCRF
jgi:hypothetical protein